MPPKSGVEHPWISCGCYLAAMQQLLPKAHRRKEVGVTVSRTRRKFNNAMFCAVMAFTLGAALPSIPTSHLAAAEPRKGTKVVNYGRPFELPTRAAFIPLPPGKIEPQRWLLDWCPTARDGYTGHMDEMHPDFRKAWAADYRMTADQLSYWDKGAWPYEGGGYWFEGLVRLGYALHDDFLIRQAKTRLDVVVTNMNEKRILFMWWLDRNNPDHVQAAAKAAGGGAQEWPVWANGLPGRVLAAYYAASGDKRILRAMEMAYSGDPSLVRKGWAMSNPWRSCSPWRW